MLYRHVSYFHLFSYAEHIFTHFHPFEWSRPLFTNSNMIEDTLKAFDDFKNKQQKCMK